MKRQRGRGRKAGSPSNRSYESNGPDVKVRGAPSHIYDKYMQLARDASSAGDRVMAENYYQHAEHYLRIMQANQPKREERDDQNASGDEAEASDDVAENGNESNTDNGGASQPEEAPRQRRPRGRRRRDDAPSEDPLQVVEPEGSEASSSSSDEGEAQPSGEEKPKKRTRTRRTKADIDAQKALDAAESDSEKKDKGEAA